MIDIVMPCYNSQSTISDVLDGIKQQTFQNFWLYIVDNSSTDKTIGIIKNHPIMEKTTLIENKTNIGFVRNTRKAISFGEKKFKALCSSNDTWYPKYLESLLSLHNKSTSLTYALPDFYVDESLAKKALPNEYFSTESMSRIESCNQVMKKFTYSSPFWGLYRSSVFTKLSPFPFERGADHVFVAEAALYGEIRMAPTQLFKRRYPAGRTAESFALMENDRYLKPSELDNTFGWHHFPYISMIRSHHKMIRRACISLEEKEELFKSSIKILATRFSRQIIQEINRFSSLRSSPPSSIVDKHYFYEIHSYVSFLENFVTLEKRS